MICKNCNAQLSDDSTFCTNCGAVLNDTASPAEEQPIYETQPTYEAQPNFAQTNYYTAPQPQTPVITSEEDLPEEYRPLSPISYFGLTMLYSIPVVGLIFMIIFSFSRGNIHRRNFTLSFWIPTIIVLALAIVALVIMLLFIPTASVSPRMAYNAILQM